MKVTHRKQYDPDTEFQYGVATWDDGSDTHKAVRQARKNTAGRHNPHSSPEVPIEQISDLWLFALESQGISDKEALEVMQEAMAILAKRVP